MRKIYIIVLLVSVVAVSDALTANKFAEKHKKKVISQHKLDIKNRDTILQELDAFLRESSEEISDGNVKLGIPVEENAITEIKDTDTFHYTGVIPPKIYGYVNTGSLNMRSEDSAGSEIVGKLKFKEKVQIIFQSDKSELIKNMRAPWLLVKKDNGDEGWVFGAFVSDDIPSEIDSDTGKTDWNMIMPASGRLSSRFGTRIDPVTKRRNSFHKGIDISAPAGTPVYAAESGTVADAGYKKSGYGNLIVIKHGSDMATYYGHLSKIIVSSGDKVKKGEMIGNVGSTGKSTGPHLHFEIRKGNQALDPEDFVR
ncbi:MAG TPA: peptidoglycan DD-metalloendopeptidase family protein [Spirochaetota bacterium]|nr:peptidoglycan DD-metalloendopeptidase family protein [Spirochaetota bacterium]HPS85237.1 peptidoglycan DD-metalloendopeptidase family protein [Spirochaetota bacterium]